MSYCEATISRSLLTANQAMGNCLCNVCVANNVVWDVKGLEGGTASRGTAARVGPSPAFKRSLPAAAFSTPLKTASLRTDMAAFSGQLQHRHANAATNVLKWCNTTPRAHGML